MGLLERIRAVLTLTRFQAIVGITAGVFSISATVGGILFASRPSPTNGEIVAIVQEARTAKPVADATIEFLTQKDALVATLQAQSGQARQILKEGAYTLRVSHPRFTTAIRQIQVLGGNSQEIRIRLALRPVAMEKDKDKDKAGPLDKLKKLFQ